MRETTLRGALTFLLVVAVFIYALGHHALSLFFLGGAAIIAIDLWQRDRRKHMTDAYTSSTVAHWSRKLSPDADRRFYDLIDGICDELGLPAISRERLRLVWLGLRLNEADLGDAPRRRITRDVAYLHDRLDWVKDQGHPREPDAIHALAVIHDLCCRLDWARSMGDHPVTYTLEEAVGLLSEHDVNASIVAAAQRATTS